MCCSASSGSPGARKSLEFLLAVHKFHLLQLRVGLRLLHVARSLIHPCGRHGSREVCHYFGSDKTTTLRRVQSANRDGKKPTSRQYCCVFLWSADCCSPSIRKSYSRSCSYSRSIGIDAGSSCRSGHAGSRNQTKVQRALLSGRGGFVPDACTVPIAEGE